MALQIVYGPGTARPTAFCDHCRERIEDAGLALYLWAPPVAGLSDTEQPDQPIYLLHKVCHRAFADDRFGDQLVQTMELSYLPIYLMSNLGIDPKKAREGARSLAGL